ncbi:hypothetical protein HMPREF9440_00973 [Sutterella parvirubra YIT 11816]|uniref:Uncharacterized protein n=1 Tax=Sutterella parvirubra YIT 11816 TaxID=762967 RepID=H3KE12_9BURK|nr:hypothetical protein HMPREF9440_00973 [Sutterella parvirubra YIT 11816]
MPTRARTPRPGASVGQSLEEGRSRRRLRASAARPFSFGPARSDQPQT